MESDLQSWEDTVSVSEKKIGCGCRLYQMLTLTASEEKTQKDSLKVYLFYMYMCVPECIYVHHICAKAHRSIKSSETGLADDSELPCKFWVLKLGPLQEQ